LSGLCLWACSDLRDYRGDWHGHRIGDADEVKVGIPDVANAFLTIDQIDEHGLHGTLTIDGGVMAATPVTSIAGAEADKLAGMTFTGAPTRVFLAFVTPSDAATGGDALALVALYDDTRIEVRVLRGGTKPLYGIFQMTEG
jgi:hypothetical protein